MENLKRKDFSTFPLWYNSVMDEHINTEIIWLAGLFEGEGWITFPKREPNSVAIGMKMTDKDVMDRVYKAVGEVGSYRFYERDDPNHKGVWTWSLGDRDKIIEIITLLLPWMGERRTSKMKEALNRLENNRGYNQPIKHGTYAGYSAEKRRGIDICDACRGASRRYANQRNKRKRENGN